MASCLRLCHSISSEQCGACTEGQTQQAEGRSQGISSEKKTRGTVGLEVLTGLCASSAHWKQNAAPHLQLMSSGSPATSALASMAFSHPAALRHHWMVTASLPISWACLDTSVALAPLPADLSYRQVLSRALVLTLHWSTPLHGLCFMSYFSSAQADLARGTR